MLGRCAGGATTFRNVGRPPFSEVGANPVRGHP